MISRLSACLLATAAVAGLSSLTSAQEGCPVQPALFHPCALARAAVFDPPRTPDGRANLQGFWRGPAAGLQRVWGSNWFPRR